MTILYFTYLVSLHITQKLKQKSKEKQNNWHMREECWQKTNREEEDYEKNTGLSVTVLLKNFKWLWEQFSLQVKGAECLLSEHRVEARPEP